MPILLASRRTSPMARTLMNTSHRSGDPSPGLGDGGEQSVPVFGPHPGSMQGALMMPFTAAKVGAVHGSASGGAEPVCCAAVCLYGKSFFGFREARVPRTFNLVGIILAAVGLLWPWIGWLRLGRLPGDIVVERQNFTLFPDHQRAPDQCGPDAVSLAGQPVRLRF
jgi:Protein of unknown function (DUF2905)